MPADGRVLQPIDEPSCLVAAAMACLEIMADVEVTDSVSLIYREAVEAGLYIASGETEATILNIMAYVGQRGALAEGGRVHGATPYRVTVAEMIQALRDGLRPFVFWYDLDGGLTHAVAATAVLSDQLVLAEQEHATATTRLMPVDYALTAGLGAFAFAAHSFDPAPVDAEYLPPGVEADLLTPWRMERKARGEDYTDNQAFLEHLEAIGADWTDPHRYGGMRHAPLAEPPAPAVFTAPEVLDASNVDIGPLIAEIATAYAIPAWALHATLIAESGLNPRAERWADRSNQGRPLTARLDADPGDEAAYNQLQRLMDELRARGAHYDVSFGYAQLIWSTAGGYGVGNGTYTLANLLDVRQRLFDRRTSVDLGARHLALCIRRVHDELGDMPNEWTLILNALACYNSGRPRPAGDSYWVVYAANVASYQAAMRTAQAAWT